MIRALMVTAVLALTACTASVDDSDLVQGAVGSTSPTVSTEVEGAAEVAAEVAARLDALDTAVLAWSDAASIEAAHAAAEEARNLVVGASGPLYGDADGDGSIDGEVTVGLLPGLDGAAGLVVEPAVNACVAADVLGGSWDDPAARWEVALTAIDSWAPGRNTFPSLPSHPQRVVGWATLTLDSEDLDVAHEYAGHARLHVDVTRAAYETCS